VADEILHLISGPRNISTALMYSFGNRADTSILDEPFYAYYLNKFETLDHPGREEIIKSQTIRYEKVLEGIFHNESNTPILFVKNMAHHLIDSDWSFLKKVKNIFLIRNPKQLIASFAQVIPQPTMQDIGLQLEYELFNYCLEQDQNPIVLDSNDVLVNPQKVISQLCNQLDIDFDANMLHWKAGPRNEDGVWAEYWYSNVHKSTGFVKQNTSNRIFPENLLPLLTEAEKYYNLLSKHSIKAN